MWDYLPVAASTYAGDIDNMIKVITYITGAWLLACYAIIIIFLIGSIKRKGKPSKYLTGEGKQKWFVLVPLIFVVLFDFGIDLANTPIWTKMKIDMPKDIDQEVRINAKQWLWEFTHPGKDGVFDTKDDVKEFNMLKVRLNAKTKFFLTASDVMHSFSVPVFRLKQDAIPGRTISGWFEATKTGTYSVQCVEICGVGHTFMAAKIQIMSDSAFSKSMTALAKEQHSQKVAVSSADVKKTAGRN